MILNSRIQNKTDKEKDQRVVTAAASNAISIRLLQILASANLIWTRTRILNPNLIDGMLRHHNFTETDLTGVNLENCKHRWVPFFTNLNIYDWMKLKGYQQHTDTLRCCWCFFMVHFDINLRHFYWNINVSWFNIKIVSKITLITYHI